MSSAHTPRPCVARRGSVGLPEDNGAWIVNELERIERLRTIRRPKRQAGGAILCRSDLTPVRVDEDRNRGGANKVMFNDRQLVILRSTTSRTVRRSVSRTGSEAGTRGNLASPQRADRQTKARADKVLIMGQRTKWGNCSAMQTCHSTGASSWRQTLLCAISPRMKLSTSPSGPLAQVLAHRSKPLPRDRKRPPMALRKR